ELRHAGFEVAALGAILHARRPIRQQTRGVHAGRHVLEARRSGAARGGFLVRGARDADRTRRDVDPPRLETAHDLAEAASPDAADESRGRAGEVLENQLGGVDALVAELADRLHHGEAGRALLDDEARHAAVARLGEGIGDGQQRERVALATVGHEHFRAGDHVGLAARDRPRANGLHVRARVRLGEAQPTARLAAGEARQQPAALGLGAVMQHDQRGHRVAVDDAGEGHPAPAQLLDHAGVRRDVEAETAVLARHQRAEQAESPHPVDQGVRVRVGVLELGRGVLEQALAERRMLFLRRVIERAGWRVHPMFVGLPSSTPSFQLAAMYGVRPDIPGFHYHDKRQREDVYFPRAGDAARVERAQASGRRGIVEGGACYGCVFTGGALQNLFTFAIMKRPSGSGLLATLSAVIVLLWVALKSTVITVVELARAVLRLLADPVGEWARGWKWLAIKLGLSVWVRELFTLAVARDVYAGVPSIYVNYLDYDVVSHAYGPRHPRALRSLRRI